jgi:hypothetical protein
MYAYAFVRVCVCSIEREREQATCRWWAQTEMHSSVLLAESARVVRGVQEAC